MVSNNNKFSIIIFVKSSNKPQNLVTLASSKGASTSSKTQIGEGLTKKLQRSKKGQSKLVHLRQQSY